MWFNGIQDIVDPDEIDTQKESSASPEIDESKEWRQFYLCKNKRAVKKPPFFCANTQFISNKSILFGASYAHFDYQTNLFLIK